MLPGISLGKLCVALFAYNLQWLITACSVVAQDRSCASVAHGEACTIRFSILGTQK